MESFLISPLRCYYDLELPENPPAQKRWPLLVALHGFRGNKDSMLSVARRVAAGRMIVIALEGPYQFYFSLGKDQHKDNVGFGWGTSHRPQDSIALHRRNVWKLIDLAVRKHHADPARVFLMGFSQSCAYNYRFAFRYPRLVRGVIGVCGGVPGEWKEQAPTRRTPFHVLHIAATRDEWYSRQRYLEIRDLLAPRVASLEFKFYNSTHRFPRTAIPDIRQWIERIGS